jgi:hypothetical protein
MDGANKQTAIVTEATQGTIPATPGWKLLRDIRLSGTRPRNAACGRLSVLRTAWPHNMVAGNQRLRLLDRPAVSPGRGRDLLLESLFCNTWSTDQMKNASTRRPFAVEEKYEGGVTDPYRRWVGCQVDSLSLAFRNDGSPGSMNFGCICMGDAADTAAIGGATYASPSPGYDPVSAIDITVGTLFGISSPKISSFTMNVRNNMRQQYAFGSAAPFGQGLGAFDIEGQVVIYFAASSNWSTFRTRRRRCSSTSPSARKPTTRTVSGSTRSTSGTRPSATTATAPTTW